MRSASAASMMSASRVSSLARCMPDPARQRPRAAEVDRQAAAGEDLREAGGLAGDDEVAQQGHVHPGAGGDAADLGDGRLRQPVEGHGDVADVAHVGEAVAVARLAHAGHVGTRAEVAAGAGEHERPGRSLLAPTSRNTASSSSHIAPLAAFLRSGRFIVTVTIPSARSTSSVSKLMLRTILRPWASTRTGGSGPDRPTTCSSSRPSSSPSPSSSGRSSAEVRRRRR